MVNAPPITTLSVPLIEASVSSVSRPPATTRRPFVAPGNVSAPVVCKLVVEVVSTPGHSDCVAPIDHAARHPFAADRVGRRRAGGEIDDVASVWRIRCELSLTM